MLFESKFRKVERQQGILQPVVIIAREPLDHFEGGQVERQVHGAGQPGHRRDERRGSALGLAQEGLRPAVLQEGRCQARSAGRPARYDDRAQPERRAERFDQHPGLPCGPGLPVEPLYLFAQIVVCADQGQVNRRR